MRVHFQRELDRLKRQMVSLGGAVQGDVRAAVRSVETRDAALARTVLAREPETNAMEVNVEEECLKILALYQPVATDLRHVVAALKINQDLERIGDLAAHIAERGQSLIAHPDARLPPEMGSMADLVQQQLQQVLEVFVNLDSAAAHAVCAADGEIDALRRAINRHVQETVMGTPALFAPFIQIMHIARHLERIADHATNIAEDLIFLIEGRIVRHTAEVSDAASAS